MKKTSTFLVVIQSLILFAFSLNIYYELTNYSKIENWYVSILDKDFSSLKAEVAFYELRTLGYKVDTYKKEINGEQVITISPPHDQGLIAFLYNRFFFNYILFIDSNGLITSHGLNK